MYLRPAPRRNKHGTEVRYRRPVPGSNGLMREERLGHLRQGRVEDLAPSPVQVVGLAELRDATPVPRLPRFVG